MPDCRLCSRAICGHVKQINQSDEAKARQVGGQSAGQFLESIGVFDLRDLSPDQWDLFLQRFLEGYAAQMRIAADDIPF